MGELSKIEWTTHTFNPWRGCTKVSPGCANCYAEALSHRNPGVLGIWGNNGTRVVASEAMWREPLKWDRAAKAVGERHRVFCASLADVFEDRDDLVEPRARLLSLINETPNLDWLLLTKRPDNVIPALIKVASTFPVTSRDRKILTGWVVGLDAPPNVWLGTSVEDQQCANERIPHLLAVPAAVRFLSMEPLLGPVEFRRVPGLNRIGQGPGLDWVIVGGESGPNARPMNPNWARDIRDQCVAAGVPFFFKQWGEWAPHRALPFAWSRSNEAIRGWGEGGVSYRVGKKIAGRILDGCTWDELPSVGQAVTS